MNVLYTNAVPVIVPVGVLLPCATWIMLRSNGSFNMNTLLRAKLNLSRVSQVQGSKDEFESGV